MEKRRPSVLALNPARISGSLALQLVTGLVLVLSVCALAVVPSHAVETSDAPVLDHPEAATAAAKLLAERKTGEAAPSKSDAPKESPLAKLPGGGYVLLPLTDAAQLGAGGKKDWVDALSALMALLTSIAWPVAAVVITSWLLKAPQIEAFLTRASRRITQVSVAGLEIKLSEGATATLEDLHKLIGQIPDTHRDWVSNSHLGPQFQMVVSDIKKYLTTSACDSGQSLHNSDFESFRFTLHVPDVLLTHSFRQLVSYVGKQRGGAGRIFSMRIGIIGKAWRMERSEYLPNNTYTEDELIERWGMTRAEAQDTSGKKNTYLAILVKSDQGLPLAVLYADSEGSKLFDHNRTVVSGNSLTANEIFELLERKIIDFSKARGLTNSLEILEDARVKVPQIDLYEPHRA